LIPGLGFCARSERCKPVDQLVKAGARKSGTAAIAAEHTGPLIASVRWPAKIKPDATPRAQFLHVNDVVPTLYDLLSITPPRLVHGVPQVQIDGRSFASTFNVLYALGGFSGGLALYVKDSVLSYEYSLFEIAHLGSPAPAQEEEAANGVDQFRLRTESSA